MSSGGTRKGMTFCVAALGEHPAATPTAPAILRKARRPRGFWAGSVTGGSLVAGPAVGEPGPRRRLLGLLAPVAVEAPAHGEGRHLSQRLHPLHLAVAVLAADAGEHVPLVREEHVIRQPVDADPLDGLALLQPLEQRLQLGGDGGVLLVLLHELVAALA